MSTNLEEAREELKTAARAFVVAEEYHPPATPENVNALKRLCESATAYARIREMVHGTNRRAQQSAGASVLVPFGKDRGKPLTEAKAENLQWLLAALRENLDDPSRSQYLEQNRRMLAAVETELNTR